MRILAVCLALLCLLLAAPQVPRELQTFVRHQDDSLNPFVGALMAADSGASAPVLPPLPRSIEGTYLSMGTCEAALEHRMARNMLTDGYLAIAELCLQQANTILQHAPSFAIAHLIRASATEALGGDRDTIRSAIQSSAEVAPGLAWMAVDRVRLLVPELPTAAGPLRAALENDVAVIAQTRAGLPVLADLYIDHEDARPVITEIVETLDPVYQRRFINAVRRAAG